ncbi:hypothetical protein HWV62_25850 [Athelia sp. TMB]|nr:hypothetical protein HWV62_25850 [Athelia sp. TMB]
MTFKALVYAYILGGLTFIPLVIVALIGITIYTSVPVGDIDPAKAARNAREKDSEKIEQDIKEEDAAAVADTVPPSEVQDIPRTRKGWLTMRHTFEESTFDGSYVTLVRSFLDARSKDPKRSRPKDMWYVVLKGKVLYLYEDEGMTECEAVLELGGHEVLVYPEGLQDGELFAKRNALCLRPKAAAPAGIASVTREMKLESDIEIEGKKGRELERAIEEKEARDAAREVALHQALPWFIFVRTNVEMEDWYHALVHASDHPAHSPTLAPLSKVFKPEDMNHLVATLDEQPDVIPMRWLNALIGRLFFSFYRTQVLESYIIGRLMKKLAKVKRPAFLTDIVVTEVSVGNTAPTLSKPMLKELTKEGDASLEVQLRYKGEVRITIEATATINLGARFKSYTVKLVLAAVLREIEGNLLIKVKRPPSNRIWYAFTAPPKIVLDVEPIVSDRQITWSMILNTIESRLKEIMLTFHTQIQESVVMPNMDDIAFFESSQFNHRGGIWDDACRHERSTPDGVPENPATEDVPSVAQTESNISVTAVAAPGTPPAPHSHSADELDVNTGTPLEGVPIARAAAQDQKSQDGSTTSMSTSPSSGSTRSRRRTWFSSVGSADLSGLKDVTEGEVIGEEEPSRGRTIEVEPPTALRSKSTPESPSKEVPPILKKEPSSDHLHPDRAPRSSSRHSQSSIEDDIGHLSDSSQTLNRTLSNSSRGGATSPSSTSSFLAALKSKAAATDKEAISNQAKETIRKWSANWASLRQSKGTTNPPDEMPDVGPSEPRARVDSGSQRASYAEVRAAVSERKERERLGHPEPGSISSIPVSIPGGKPKSRTVSVSSSNVHVQPPSPSLSAVSSSPTPPSAANKRHSGHIEGTPPKISAPTISRSTTTANSHSHDPFSADPFSADPFSADTDGDERTSAPAAPIQSQPQQAKTMMVPRIHASHKDDVKSMGFVAPSPPPNTETKISPAIQSVYRLWKSPTSSAQQSQDSVDKNADVQPLSLNGEGMPKLPPPVRPAPPPLPPRSNSTQIPATTTSVDPSLPPSSPASEALKSIRQMDGIKRTQDDGKSVQSSSPDLLPTQVPPVNKPPLPPRKLTSNSTLA